MKIDKYVCLMNMHAKNWSCILNVHLEQLPCLHIQGSFSRWIHVGCDFPLLKCFLHIYRSPASPPWMHWTPLPWWRGKCSRGLPSLHCWRHKSDPGLCCGLRGNSQHLLSVGSQWHGECLHRENSDNQPGRELHLCGYKCGWGGHRDQHGVL